MANIHTEIVKSAHAYTRSEMPWLLGTCREKMKKSTRGGVFGWKLFHYLSGGGMRAFGRSIEQEEMSWRQTRFLRVCGVLGLVWLWFYI